MPVMRRIFALTPNFGKLLFVYFVLTLLASVFSVVNFTLLIPLLNVLFGLSGDITPTKPEFSFNLNYFTQLFNYYFHQFQINYGKAGALQFTCVLLIIASVFRNLFTYLGLYSLERIRANQAYSLRKLIFDKITTLHVGFFTNERRGDLASKVTVDVQEIENSVLESIRSFIREPLLIIGAFVAMSIISFKLFLFTLIVIPLSGAIIGAIIKRIKISSNIVQDTLGRMASIVGETLEGIRVIKAFNGKGYIRNKFDDENRKYSKHLFSIRSRVELASPFSEFSGIIVVSFILLYGGTMVLSNEQSLTASAFVTFLAIFSQVLTPAKALSRAAGSVSRAISSGKRIFELIDTPTAVTDKPNAIAINKFESSIEFKNVVFGYEEKNVLNGVSFTVSRGQTVALVGPSGSGKTTLANLTPRFYDVRSGNIFIDGKDMRDYTVDSLRNLMGIVTQESILFNDTIFNNIAFCKPNVTLAEVEQAARIANAHNFISDLPDGYNTNIGDSGLKLSGGQRQRLSIARAVLLNPEILILDEATSALDTESEKLVQEAISNLMKNRTSLVIAHRLSTIVNADKIVVIESGQVVEQGTHQELSANNGLYKRLIDMQQLGV